MARELNIQGEFFFTVDLQQPAAIFLHCMGYLLCGQPECYCTLHFGQIFQLFQDNTNSENDLEFVIADIFAVVENATQTEFKCMAFQVLRFS